MGKYKDLLFFAVDCLHTKLNIKRNSKLLKKEAMRINVTFEKQQQEKPFPQIFIGIQ